MKRHILLLSLLLSLSLPVQARTFTVTSAAGSGSNSLAWAISQANFYFGHDTIAFNIPGSGVHRIQPTTQLPYLVDPTGVLIDGLSQPGSFAGSKPPATSLLKIELNGALAYQAHGLWIKSSNNVIRGLIINEFDGNGIIIEAVLPAAHSNYIFANFIGTDSTGRLANRNGKDTLAYYAGVLIATPPPPFTDSVKAFNNIIEGNLLSANFAEGISIVSSPPGDVYQNTVLNNYIGTDILGSNSLGNAHTGIYLGEATHHNVIEHNLISGNQREGISMTGVLFSPTVHRIVHHNEVRYNLIGLAIDGVTALPNQMDGVSIGDYGSATYGHAQYNWVHHNQIAFNGDHGVEVTRLRVGPISPSYCYGNKITSNSIYRNGKLGIDLENDGVNPNDPADQDAGANDRFNHPDIRALVQNGPQATIAGTVEIGPPGGPHPVLLLEVFKADPDPSGSGEGRTYLGRTLLNTHQKSWTITVGGLNPGDWVTTTLTDTFNGHTSEFSPNFYNQPSAITATSQQQNVSCHGGMDGSATVMPTGGTGIYQFWWSNGAIGPMAQGLAAGPCHVIVADNAGNGTVVFFNITQPPPHQLMTLPAEPSCQTCTDGSIHAMMSGGTPPYTYQWDNGHNGPDLNNVPNGIYCVTATDANGCWLIACDTLNSTVNHLPPELAAGIRLFPNPTPGIVILDLPSGLGSTRLEVLDFTGRKLERQWLEEGEQQVVISLSDWPKGMYLLYLHTEQGSHLLKVVRR
jgi:parallel beta-helix repeat protein